MPAWFYLLASFLWLLLFFLRRRRIRRGADLGVASGGLRDVGRGGF